MESLEKLISTGLKDDLVSLGFKPCAVLTAPMYEQQAFKKEGYALLFYHELHTDNVEVKIVKLFNEKIPSILLKKMFLNLIFYFGKETYEEYLGIRTRESFNSLEKLFFIKEKIMENRGVLVNFNEEMFQIGLELRQSVNPNNKNN